MSKNAIARVGTAGISAVFVLLFVILWGSLLLDVFTFDATETLTTVQVTPAQQTVLSFLAATVATGTAAVLGITIVNAEGDEGSRVQGFSANLKVAGSVIRESVVLWAGILAYLLIGLLVVLAWYFRSDVAPDVLNSFGASVLGWLAGAFAAVFTATDD